MASRHENRAKDGGYNYAPEIASEGYLNKYQLKETVMLTVLVQLELYRNEANGWSVYMVEAEDYRFKISGTFTASLSLGTYYQITGTVDEYNNERQVSVKKYEAADVASEEEILNVLRTIEELNTSAYSVYRKYGPNILKDIKEAPEKVARTLCVPLQDVSKWKAKLCENSEVEGAFSILKEYGISDRAAKELLDKYSVFVLQKIEENPYFLIDELSDFSFKKCDEIALKKGYPYDGPERVMYGILSILAEASYQKGHCFLPDEEFNPKVRSVLNFKLNYRQAYSLYKTHEEQRIFYQGEYVSGWCDREALRTAMIEWQAGTKSEPFAFYYVELSDEAIANGMRLLLNTNRVVKKDFDDGHSIFQLGYLSRAEETVASVAKSLCEAEYDSFPDNEDILNKVCEHEGVILEEKQREAALRFTKAKGGLFILNGAAGCGKTFVLNLIIKTLKEAYKKRHAEFNAKVLAPTGKAAQVAHNATSLVGHTIHRELGYIRSSFLDRSGEMISEDCLIVDEFSMVDISLASELFSHIGLGTKVIILGDTEQLPSIGPGSVLKDMINSQVIPMVTLNVVKRQAGGSAILENAQRILRGEPIVQKVLNKDGDAHVVYKEDLLSVRNVIMNLARKTTKMYGLKNVQVLCPQKKTQVGVEVMNYCIQAAVNPVKPGDVVIPAKKIKVNTGSKEEDRTLYFKAGDKVIHTKNDYNMHWYYVHELLGLTVNQERVGIINGEMGIIAKVEISPDKKKKKIYVKYPDGYVIYENDFSELEHAYAITIHKSQGSQWPVVISPVCSVNKIMLSRKIMYTLYTRAQNLSFVIGDQAAIEYAVKNNKNAYRYTDLENKLRKKFGETPPLPSLQA